MSARLFCDQCNRAIAAEGLELPPARVLHCPHCQSIIAQPSEMSAQTAITALPPATSTAIVPADRAAAPPPFDGDARAENKPPRRLFALAVIGFVSLSAAFLLIVNRFTGPVVAVAGAVVSFALGIGGMVLAITPDAGKQRAGGWLMPFAILGGVLLLGVALVFGFVILRSVFL
jgi:hypothetical protein